MRRSLLTASVIAATLAGGIAAAQAPYPQTQTTRAPITTATVSPRPVRLSPAAREVGPSAEPPGGPYAAMDEPAAQATAAYPPAAAAQPRPVHVAQQKGAAAQEPGAAPSREGAASGASQRGAAQAAVVEPMNGRMGRLLHDGMSSLFETCPQMARSTGIQTQKLANGITISYVSDDPVVVERLQKMADAVRLMREASAE